MNVCREQVCAVLLVALGLMLSACGGKQSGGSCPSVREGMTVESQGAWARCAERAEVSAGECRAMLAWATAATPAVLESAVRCVLATGERTDSALVVEALERVVTDSARVTAIGAGLAPHFSAQTHGVSLAGSLSTAGERALGGELGRLDAQVREELLDVALAQGLHVLVELGYPWLREREDATALASAYARQLEADDALSEAQRWALVRGGAWSSDELVDCALRRSAVCREWSGEHPLALLALDERVSTRNAQSTSRVAEQIAAAGGDPAAVVGILTWLSRPETPNGAAMVHAMLGNMQSPQLDRELRWNLANNATEPMCVTDRLRGLAVSFGSESLNDGNGIFATWVRRCSEHFWGAPEHASALALGGLLGVPASLVSQLQERLREQLGAVDCTAVVALGELLVTARQQDPVHGRVWTELAQARPECADAVAPRVAEVAAATSAHPEARLRAIGWLAARGDRGQCRAVDAAARWNVDRSGVPLGHHHDALLRETRAACNR